MASPTTQGEASPSTITIEAITSAMENVLEKKSKERLDPVTKSVNMINKRVDKMELNVKNNMDEMKVRMDKFEQSGGSHYINGKIQETDNNESSNRPDEDLLRWEGQRFAIFERHPKSSTN